MNFVVCIKQVPDTHDVKINPETNTLMREGVEAIINPFDMYAIEEALRLRDRMGGTVTAVTMGPPQAEAALREAISMGVNTGILVSDRAFAGSDTWATSYTLSKALEKIGDYTVIIFGKQASDGDTAQVGPGVATHLDLPQITYVRKVEEIDENRIVAERLLETGYEAIESPLPCVMTVVKEINEPRLPSLKGKMAARKAEIVTWGAADIEAEADKLGLDGSPTKVVKVFTPPAREGGEMLEGEPGEIATQLAEKLKDIIIEAAS
ncbi:MAG: electron transfer flavoprotein subunit beta/FixA family protein [Verrucomicrobia bacterium]|jgi:electron transfer flavoprotein beta subunit|nr:electron transfer flavoprotein subunit beta/FixA family protein [Verrucomicrobiota bacterium]